METNCNIFHIDKDYLVTHGRPYYVNMEKSACKIFNMMQ